jgi:hypothetical protein
MVGLIGSHVAAGAYFTLDIAIQLFMYSSFMTEVRDNS